MWYKASLMYTDMCGVVGVACTMWVAKSLYIQFTCMQMYVRLYFHVYMHHIEFAVVAVCKILQRSTGVWSDFIWANCVVVSLYTAY